MVSARSPGRGAATVPSFQVAPICQEGPHFAVPSGSCGIVKMANKGLLEYVHGQFEDASVGSIPLHVRMTYCERFEKPAKHSRWSASGSVC